MDIILTGHDYKYAVEQMLLTLYPAERPNYPARPSGGSCVSLTLADGTAWCALTVGGGVFHGEAAVGPYGSALEQNRQEQRAVKLAFYRAALASGHEKPVWGALTGVKPGKLMARYLDEGKTAEDFARDFDVSPERAAICRTTAQAARQAKRSLAPEDLCLYVGIPFCPTRCAYCSFIASAVGQNLKLMEPYLAALEKEIGQTAIRVREAGLRPAALYMGGGTPTTLSAPQLDELCTALERAFDLSALREYTVEAGRPDTITAEKLRVLRAHGVTRVSVNPQSMSDEVLEAIGRFHTAQDILDAVKLVRQAGDFELNMDLIAGLPKDSPAGFSRTLDAVLALAPENVTVHTLSIKNGSYLAQRPETLPPAAEVAAMLDEAAERLSAAGYAPYYLYRQKYMSGGFENLGWAKPGTENLYNICMMEELCDVVALGAGGSSKFPAPDGSIRRRVNPKYPLEYMERIDQNGL